MLSVNLLTSKWSKECPDCKSLQIYNSWDSLRCAIRRNNICRKCNSKNRTKYSLNDWKRECPICKKEVVYTTYLNWWRACDENRMCEVCADIHTAKTRFKHGHPNLCISEDSRKKISNFHKERYSNPSERKKASQIAKTAMHKPDVRRKHLEALAATKYLGKPTDKGQVELIQKWNRLGFQFEPNYQVHEGMDLFYLDGYDTEHKIVLEYDSKYHLNPKQKKKDEIRQNKIIDILKPTKFWRYDSVNKKFRNVLERNS